MAAAIVRSLSANPVALKDLAKNSIHPPGLKHLAQAFLT